ncbi:soma ferritin-like isoform X1 [Biomphalaria glabrata]|uniref:Ferritin n=3 Tax=Biomphalaria TaxID=6525 RepID=A0A9U8DV24_BIOGL|nr:soma ferritin-like isoform X1 [Biomphalaria glabrata]
MSLARQNYNEECEAAVNRQINLELYASYVYLSMAYHFDRDDVALPGFHKFFKKMSQEETGHAELLMKYQNNRGGRVVLQDIKKPDTDDWGNGLAAMTTALKLERDVNTSLLELHKIAETNYDPHLDDFVEEELLGEQVKSIKELADYVAQLTRVGPGLGEYMFDKETLQKL